MSKITLHLTVPGVSIVDALEELLGIVAATSAEFHEEYYAVLVCYSNVRWFLKFRQYNLIITLYYI